jgi:hypothetical protein
MEKYFERLYEKRRLAIAFYQRLQVFLYFTKRFQKISIKTI